MQTARDHQTDLNLRGFEKAQKKGTTLVPGSQRNITERSWRKADNTQPPVNELTAKKFSVYCLPGTLMCVKIKIIHLR